MSCLRDDTACGNHDEDVLKEGVSGDEAMKHEPTTVPKGKRPAEPHESLGDAEYNVGYQGLSDAFPARALLGSPEQVENPILRRERGDGTKVSDSSGSYLAALRLGLDSLLGHALENNHSGVVACYHQGLDGDQDDG
ncbi:hypothetical protein B296_00050778 [Ensete ventricosum]|uniref:Uncharacterized protein n=1 Tax=Ensete ventricosum TaxID=4639 RepID=A0A426X9M4_ENSVE|nr:hypothetical protein B296_00050778 [Ensete ventricosum]